MAFAWAFRERDCSREEDMVRFSCLMLGATADTDVCKETVASKDLGVHVNDSLYLSRLIVHSSIATAQNELVHPCDCQLTSSLALLAPLLRSPRLGFYTSTPTTS